MVDNRDMRAHRSGRVRDIRKWLGLGCGLLLIGFGGAYGYKLGFLWPARPSVASFPVRILDVSHHQGTVDWQRVGRSGLRYVWIKATEGSDWTDPAFRANRDGASEAGVRWGAYHFFTFCSDPTYQAAHFVDKLDGDFGALPPAVDVEIGGNCSARPTPAALRDSLATFIQAVEQTLGRQLVVYFTEDQAATLFGASGPPRRRLWVRNLWAAPQVHGGRAWTVWQYHSRGWVSGVGAFIDLNVFSGSNEEFLKLLDERCDDKSATCPPPW